MGTRSIAGFVATLLWLAHPWATATESVAVAEPEKSTITFQGIKWTAPQGVSFSIEDHRGCESLRIRGHAAFTAATDLQFSEGRVEFDLALCDRIPPWICFGVSIDDSSDKLQINPWPRDNNFVEHPIRLKRAVLTTDKRNFLVVIRHRQEPGRRSKQEDADALPPASRSSRAVALMQRTHVPARWAMAQALELRIQRLSVLDRLVNSSKSLGAEVFWSDRDNHPVGRDQCSPRASIEVGWAVDQNDVICRLNIQEFTDRVLAHPDFLGTGRIELLQILACRANVDSIKRSWMNQRVPVAHTEHFDPFAPTLGDPMKYPSDQTNETAPDSVSLYRKLLAEAPDHSVKIVVVGYATCPALLLRTEANHNGDGIPLSGSELVQRKVIELVQMAGVGPGRSDTFNLGHDAEAAVYVERHWPTSLVYSAPGTDIPAGSRLTDPETNPVAKAFELYPGAGSRGVIGDRSCWDEVATIFAVHGEKWRGKEIWKKSQSGSIDFTIRKLKNPKNKAKDTAVDTHWSDHPDEGRSYLLQLWDKKETADMIEELMIQPPRIQRNDHSISTAAASSGQADTNNAAASDRTVESRGRP